MWSGVLLLLVFVGLVESLGRDGPSDFSSDPELESSFCHDWLS